VWGWAPDAQSLAIYGPEERARSVDIYDIRSQQRRPLLSHSSFAFFDAATSPNGGWIAFTAGPFATNTQIYIAPVRATPVRESDWIPVTRDGGSFSAWSPDNGVLYFHSRRDGFSCIWSQKLDAAKRPDGAAQAVQHFHSVSFGAYLMNPSDFHMSVAKDRMVLNLMRQTANLWITEEPIDK
jgi:Tol biopolymer transport system component